MAHALRLLEGIAHRFHLDEWKSQRLADLTPAVTAFLAKHLTRRPLAAGSRLPFAPSL